MGSGRWGGRPSPHGRDVGQSYQGETLKGFAPTGGMGGAVNKENDGEGLPAFRPKEGGSLNREALGEMRNSGNAKPPGDPKHIQSNFNPSKSGGSGAGESGSKPPGEPGVGGKQFNSKGSPGNMVSAKDREPAPVRDGGPGSGPKPGGGKLSQDPEDVRKRNGPWSTSEMQEMGRTGRVTHPTAPHAGEVANAKNNAKFGWRR